MPIVLDLKKFDNTNKVRLLFPLVLDHFEKLNNMGCPLNPNNVASRKHGIITNELKQIRDETFHDDS